MLGPGAQQGGGCLCGVRLCVGGGPWTASSACWCARPCRELCLMAGAVACRNNIMGGFTGILWVRLKERSKMGFGC